MKRTAESAEDYVAQLEGKQRQMVQTLRGYIAEAVPDVEEGIRYGMLDYPGLANLAAQKQYVALYVASAVLAKHKDQFPGLNCGKSCMRFRSPDQLDEARIKALLKDVRAWRLANPSREDTC